MDVNQSATVEFKDIGIIFVKRENIKNSLEERRKANIDPTNGVFLCDHLNERSFHTPISISNDFANFFPVLTSNLNRWV